MTGIAKATLLAGGFCLALGGAAQAADKLIDGVLNDTVPLPAAESALALPPEPWYGPPILPPRLEAPPPSSPENSGVSQTTEKPEKPGMTLPATETAAATGGQPEGPALQEAGALFLLANVASGLPILAIDELPFSTTLGRLPLSPRNARAAMSAGLPGIATPALPLAPPSGKSSPGVGTCFGTCSITIHGVAQIKPHG